MRAAVRRVLNDLLHLFYCRVCLFICATITLMSRARIKRLFMNIALTKGCDVLVLNKLTTGFLWKKISIFKHHARFSLYFKLEPPGLRFNA